MNSIRPGARAMISGARAWMARNFAMRASVIGSAKGTKARARLEAHKFHRRDLHRPAGVRVESIPGGALRHRERPKPGEMHLGVPPEAETAERNSPSLRSPRQRAAGTGGVVPLPLTRTSVRRTRPMDLRRAITSCPRQNPFEYEMAYPSKILSLGRH